MAFCTKADGDRVAAAARRMKRGNANLVTAIPTSTWELAARADVGGRRPAAHGGRETGGLWRAQRRARDGPPGARVGGRQPAGGLRQNAGGGGGGRRKQKGRKGKIRKKEIQKKEGKYKKDVLPVFQIKTAPEISKSQTILKFD